MVPTPLTTQQSGIPPASSILASLGCKVLQVAVMVFAVTLPGGVRHMDRDGARPIPKSSDRG
ncbi:MAG TPA: hypothetical protein VJQ54_21435 [Candidatus Sulfotelmatobacter sp.]|nr:hypothetical protein [Candidatus Sulfotelmatobacter sp.]